MSVDIVAFVLFTLAFYSIKLAYDTYTKKMFLWWKNGSNKTTLY